MLNTEAWLVKTGKAKSTEWGKEAWLRSRASEYSQWRHNPGRAFLEHRWEEQTQVVLRNLPNEENTRGVTVHLDHQPRQALHTFWRVPADRTPWEQGAR